MEKITKTQAMDAYFRAVLLSDKTDELREQVSGTGTSFLAMISDEDGKIIPEKRDALIKELIESFKHYSELENRKLKKWEEEMFSCFLYCAMTMPREKRNRFDPYMGLSRRSRSFADIIAHAEDAAEGQDGVKSYRDFLKAYYAWYRDWCMRKFEGKTDPDFSDKRSRFCAQLMSSLRSAFMKPEYFLDIPRETRIELCEEYARENGIWENENSVYLQIAEDPEAYYNDIAEIRENDSRYPDPRAGIFAEDDDNKADDYYERLKEDERRNKTMRAVQAALIAGSYEDNELLKDLTPSEIIRYAHIQNTSGIFEYLMHDVEINELQKRFQRFAELFYDKMEHDRAKFSEDVKRMVETYLIENGLCPFSFGDDYGLVTYQIEKAQKRIISEIERVKKI